MPATIAQAAAAPGSVPIDLEMQATSSWTTSLEGARLRRFRDLEIEISALSDEDGLTLDEKIERDELRELYAREASRLLLDGLLPLDIEPEGAVAAGGGEPDGPASPHGSQHRPDDVVASADGGAPRRTRQPESREGFRQRVLVAIRAVMADGETKPTQKQAGHLLTPELQADSLSARLADFEPPLIWIELLQEAKEPN